MGTEHDFRKLFFLYTTYYEISLLEEIISELVLDSGDLLKNYDANYLKNYILDKLDIEEKEWLAFFEYIGRRANLSGSAQKFRSEFFDSNNVFKWSHLKNKTTNENSNEQESYQQSEFFKLKPINYAALKPKFKSRWKYLFNSKKYHLHKYSVALSSLSFAQEFGVDALCLVFEKYLPLYAQIGEHGESFNLIEKLPGILNKAGSDDKFFLLLSESGYGKTTALLYLYAKYASAPNNFTIIYADCTYDLQNVYSIPDKSNCILLLDSFDEAKEAWENSENFFSEIETGTQSFAKVVIACRSQFFTEKQYRKATNIKRKRNIDILYNYKHLIIFPPEVEHVLDYAARFYYNPGTDEYLTIKRILDKAGDAALKPFVLKFIPELINLAGKGYVEISSYLVYNTIVAQWIGREDLSNEQIWKNFILNFSNILALEFYKIETENKSDVVGIRFDRLLELLHLNNIEYQPLQIIDRSLITKSIDQYYRFAHRTLKEYFYAELLFEGFIEEHSFDRHRYTYAWGFYVEKCKLAAQKIPVGLRVNAAPLNQCFTDEKANLCCLAFQSIAWFTGKPIGGYYTIFEYYKNLLPDNSDLCNTLIKLASYALKNDVTKIPYNIAEKYLEPNVRIDDLAQVLFLHFETLNNQVFYSFLHRSFTEFMVLYDLLNETDENSFNDMLKEFNPEVIRFAYLFSTEVSFLQKIKFKNTFKVIGDYKKSVVSKWELEGKKQNYYTFAKNLAKIEHESLSALVERVQGADMLAVFSELNTDCTEFLQFRLFQNFRIEKSDFGYWLKNKSLNEEETAPKYLNVVKNQKPAVPAMIKVIGSTFEMGSKRNIEGDENLHSVSVSDFSMAKNPITNKQFAAFVADTDYKTNAEKDSWSICYFYNEPINTYHDILLVGRFWQFDEWGKPFGTEKDDYPVIHVSWYDAIAYCNWLNKELGLPAAYDEIGNLLNAQGNITTDIREVKGYRLPTEAEWEFAAKGGNLHENFEYSGSDDFEEVAHCWERNKDKEFKLHKVETLKYNGLGIYNMSGNVWEWCYDWYATYESGEQTNPTGAKSGSDRVFRGGGWNFSARRCRAAFRDSRSPGSRISGLGFRVVL